MSADIQCDVDDYDNDGFPTPLLSYEEANGGVVDPEYRRERRRRAAARSVARRNRVKGRRRGT